LREFRFLRAPKYYIIKRPYRYLANTSKFNKFFSKQSKVESHLIGMAEKLIDQENIASDYIALVLDPSSDASCDTSTLNYLAHTEGGVSLRALARQSGVHASTIMRQVRRVEGKRDDPLVDAFLHDLGQFWTQKSKIGRTSVTIHTPKLKADPKAIRRAEAETLRVMRRLCEKGNFIAVTPGLEKAVIMNQSDSGEHKRVAVLDCTLAQNLVARDWVERTRAGRVMCYAVTDAGRAALRRMLAEQDGDPMTGFAEAPTPFAEQHRVWGHRDINEDGAKKPRRVRVNLSESPVTMLARKKGKDGKAFLSRELVDAAERLREDFELAQLGPRVTQNWEKFITGSVRGNFGSGSGGGSAAAQKRLGEALTALGSGLADIVMRCCCFLEGLESAEKRMGWSARSGKIVLRIALLRLRQHYEEVEQTGYSRKIG
jgi:DNA-binding MarR family transcriptional regulator